MANKIIERVKKLEEATRIYTPMLIYIGEEPDGQPQYLDVMTGKFIPELLPNHVIVGRVRLDLKEI